MIRSLAIFTLLLGQLAAFASKSDALWISGVEPVLDKYCLKCHAGVRQKGGLDLRSLETMLRGGEHGPAILPGHPETSHLVQNVLADGDPHMPSIKGKQLTDAEINTFRTWIKSLPPAKDAVAGSTNTAWIPNYLADLQRNDAQRLIAPPKLSATETIDWFVAAKWKERKTRPADRCDDATFVRRIYLDLAGRIPSKAEADGLLIPGKRIYRAALVDQLLASKDYATHMREFFDVVLMGRFKPQGKRNSISERNHDWREFLESSFRENRPWNEMVREMILARSTNAPARGASWFLYERNNNYQEMAEAISPVVYGAQIKCAQCHNHPLAWEIEQRHYWGLVAAFNRSKNIETAAGASVSESAIGGFIKFANLKKESQPATLSFLNGKSVGETIPDANAKEVDQPDLYLVAPAKDGSKAAGPAVPKFSRREAFADAVTHDNPLLARAFVNRIWGKLLGRGIVQPVDDIDSRHRPSHPELLAWLTQDFMRSNYDVQQLIHNIVLSHAYQLSTKSAKVPPADSFAIALEKPLSAEQLLHSLIIATGNAPSADGKISSLTVEEMSESFASRFADVMPVAYNPSLQQALFLSNSQTVDELLKPVGKNTAAQLLALPSNEKRVREAFSIVFGRAPDRDELSRTTDFLNSQPAEKGVKNMVWALLTSAEFQMNH